MPYGYHPCCCSFKEVLKVLRFTILDCYGHVRSFKPAPFFLRGGVIPLRLKPCLKKDAVTVTEYVVCVYYFE